jgi:hypothetical protein
MAKPSRPVAAKKPSRRARSPTAESQSHAAAPQPESGLLQWLGGLSGITESALRLAGLGGDAGGSAVSRTPAQLRLMAAAGESLRDVREVAGLTIAEIAAALDLRDKSVWKAVEDGREVLSFELILRLASLLARNDPLPFVLRMTRSYQPRLWRILHELGLDGLPLQFEREREFINIFRSHDAARNLPDAEWTRLLAFTQQAFDLGLSALDPAATAGTKRSTASRSTATPSAKRRPRR